MENDIKAANLVRYNANSAGNDTGDCVKRALSLAFDMDYNALSKLLRAESKKSELAWNTPIVYRSVARELGAGKFIYVPSKESQTVDDFIDDHCQTGTWLLETGRSPNSSATHICCVIDGTLYDSWDSGYYYVSAYSEVDIKDRRAFTGIETHMEELAEVFASYVKTFVDKYIGTYARKGNEWAEQFSYKVFRSKAVDNQCVCMLTCWIGQTSYSSKEKEFTLKFVGVITPTDTYDDADRKLKETARTRVYDRLWTVNDLEKKAKETYEAEQEQGGQVKTWILGDRKRGNAFYRNMPAWARAACSEIYVDRPGVYSNSYEVTLQEPGTGASLKFYAPTADLLRNELEIYYKTGDLIDVDYSLSDVESGDYL